MSFLFTYRPSYRLSGLLFWLLLIGITCHKRDTIEAPPAELQRLLENFVVECSERGIPITNLQSAATIRFGRIQEHAGSCKPQSYPKVITIDSIKWRVLSPAAREILVYHELSHCLLNRQHDNRMLALGECKSWMRSGSTGCTINSLNTAWRQYYIDELFLGDSLETPNWYDLESLPDHNERITSISGKIQTLKSNTLSFDSVYFNGQPAWVIMISFQLSDQPKGGFGLRINEYTLELGVSPRFANPEEVDINRWIMLEQFSRMSPHNMLSLETSAASTWTSATISIRRINQSILVYFEDKLKLCIPIQDAGVILSGYNSFTKIRNPVTIRVHAF